VTPVRAKKILLFVCNDRLLAYGWRGRQLALFDHVGNMQECGALQADFDERRLHARQHPAHLAEIDVAYQPAMGGAFQVDFLHHTFAHYRHARFLRGDVDQDIFSHAPITSIPNSRNMHTVSASGRPTMPV